MDYRIGSFNVRKLTIRGIKDEDFMDGPSNRDYATIGRIIRENFDIIALQEVMKKEVLSLLFPYGCQWEYRWELSRSKIKDSDEGYAFAWNARRIRLMAEPHIWDQYRKDEFLGSRGLIRDPYYGRFTPSETLSRGPFCEFRLINTHIYFGKNDTISTQYRFREFIILTKQILRRLTDKRYGDSMPAYAFLLGDFNLNIEQLRFAIDTDYYYTSRYENDNLIKEQGYEIVQCEKTTIRRRQVESGSEEQKNYEYDGFANSYDHFAFDDSYQTKRGLTLNADAVNSVMSYKSGDYERHFKEISDHIPIKLEIDLRHPRPSSYVMLRQINYLWEERK